MEGNPRLPKTGYRGTGLKITNKNSHILVILYICLEQMLGNENIFHTIALLASSCPGCVCNLIKKSLQTFTSATQRKILKKEIIMY